MFIRIDWRAAARATATLIFALFPAGAAFAQSSWDRYQPGTLMDAVRDADSTIRIAIRESPPALQKDAADKRPSDHFLHGNPTLATVVYKGRSRPINPIRVSLLRDWGLSFLRDSTLSADFHREYLFQEGDSLFWLPVQDRVAAYFPKEVRPGQRVNLYVILIAGEYLDGKITWAFIVNEFNTKPIAKAF